MAILGDFAFYAGNSSEELVKYKPESCKVCNLRAEQNLFWNVQRKDYIQAEMYKMAEWEGER